MEMEQWKKNMFLKCGTRDLSLRTPIKARKAII